VPATPLRTCVACNRKAPKETFLRIGKHQDGRVGIEPEGRGAYVCINLICVSKAIAKRVIARKLKTSEKSIDWPSLEIALMEKVNALNA